MLARIRERNLQNWVVPYAAHRVGLALRPPIAGPRHLLFAICDHYEPEWRRPPKAQSRARVQAWAEGYAKAFAEFRDADGRPPRHTFFFPGEEYAPEYLEPLAGLVRQGFGEVEVHLHHDRDTATGLRSRLQRALADFGRHGHVSRDRDGRPRWAFVHGDWALSNPRPDGRMCGVDGELPILFEEGCYADFTFPSAPDSTQPRVVNRIYWPTGDLARNRVYDRGVRARVGEVHRDRPLFIQGPIALMFDGRRLRIEAAALQAGDPPTPTRVDAWARQAIHVQGRPEWVFVKLHSHGAPEKNATSLLGPEGRRMHEYLSARYNDGRRWILHYVTAREMYNVAVAAMEGATGDPALHRDHVVPPPPAAAR